MKSFDIDPWFNVNRSPPGRRAYTVRRIKEQALRLGYGVRSEFMAQLGKEAPVQVVRRTRSQTGRLTSVRRAAWAGGSAAQMRHQF